MPRYFFDFRGPEDELPDNDKHGTTFAGKDDAVTYAKRIVRELQGPEGMMLPAGWLS
jgi:hypothetical protein